MKIAEALAKVPEPSEEEDYSSDISPEEIDAMKLFSKASDPEGKAKALKLFLEACGVA